jgi:hypothetical protein
MNNYTERERFLMGLNADLFCLISDFIHAIDLDDREILAETVKEAISVLVEFGGRDEIPTKVQ